MNSFNRRKSGYVRVDGPNYAGITGVVLGVAALVGVIILAIVLGNHSADPVHAAHGTNVDTQLIAEVPNVLSATMFRRVTGFPFNFVPPDPHVVVGKETMMVFVNSLVSIYDKATLARIAGPVDGIGFFPGTDVIADFAFFDPYAVWDPHSERIWISALSFTDGLFVRGYICVSKTHSPRAASDFYCYKQDFPDYPFTDFPKIDVDENALYYTTWDFVETGIQPVIRVYDKQPLMDGTSPFDLTPVNVVNSGSLDPYGSDLGYQLHFPWPTRNPQPRATDKLRQTIFVSHGEDRGLDAVPELATDNRIVLEYLNGALGVSPQLVRVELTVPEYTVGRYTSPQPAPLKDPVDPVGLFGTDNFAVMFSPVLSRDMLYVAHPTRIGERTAIRWYQIDVSQLVSHNQATLVQFGTIDDGISSFSFPSIAVDANDNVAFGFNIQSPDQFIKPGYTIRLKNDPVGTVRFPLRDLAPGDHYYQVGPGFSPYGDYSGMVIDHIDGTTFWMYNQYVYEVPPAAGAFNFGTAWNTKLAAFKVEATGGELINAPQTAYYLGGTAADIIPSVRRYIPNHRRQHAKARTIHKRITASEMFEHHMSRHAPVDPGYECHRVHGQGYVCNKTQT